MDKKAQKRGLTDKLREMTNISGRAAEKFFNPQLKKIMDDLRSSDDKIRAILSGVKIGDQDPGPDPVSAKELLKSAKSNLNRREFLTAATELSRFYKKFEAVDGLVSKLNFGIDKVHHDFMFKDIGDKHREHLLNLHDFTPKVAAPNTDSLIKEAGGVLDFLNNITSKRGRALAAWEKRYPLIAGNFRDKTKHIIEKSEKLLDNTLSALKEMATYRATRKIDPYLESAKLLSIALGNYKKTITDKSGKDVSIGFDKYFNETVKPWIAKFKQWEQDQSVSNRAIEPSSEFGAISPPNLNSPNRMNSVNVSDPSAAPGAPISTSIPESVKPETWMGGYSAPKNLPTGNTSFTPTVKFQPTPAETIPPPASGVQLTPEKQKEIEEDRSRLIRSEGNHSKFLTYLESLSGESPIILSSFIRKYAKSIQVRDPESALQLFNICKNIVK